MTLWIRVSKVGFPVSLSCGSGDGRWNKRENASFRMKVVGSSFRPDPVAPAQHVPDRA